MTIIDKLIRFVRRVFKTNLEVFLEALKHSPNAQGYVSGSITELLLKKKLEEEYGMEVKRIREKWEGRKHAHHHGDLYFRERDGKCWYVLESKGVKSNSEKWHRLYNYERLKSFLVDHANKIQWINRRKDIEKQVTDWLESNLPKFRSEYSANLYEYEEIKNYKPTRETEKARTIESLRKYTREESTERLRNVWHM